MEQIYFAGGCLWGVQEFMRHIPGVISTQAGRANGTSNRTDAEYDGYAECVHIDFDPEQIALGELIECLFEIIDPYSINQQGQDIGPKYRTGIYSREREHLDEAHRILKSREDYKQLTIEVLPLSNYVKSDDEHQDRLTRHPEDHSLCHIPLTLLYKYKKAANR
ncbi:peptide-methionine (S)-S-oxide reductase [Marinobacterium sp. xm-d-530]|uniref:peptide-methionine (S)-S-oxide reductase n=1 Tax=Marinobacterium sp. xm-d-530 TaxID=2497747 RepID=UPI001568BAC8|nr:peptide-methionine (S)-S-oxide reductase [Marinobacterium sp. xm-d-530]NRQ00876.1 Peptide methionine sulfoxide reductase msrA/msrB [Marinobacterium sp. xm-d-530]